MPGRSSLTYLSPTRLAHSTGSAGGSNSSRLDMLESLLRQSVALLVRILLVNGDEVQNSFHRLSQRADEIFPRQGVQPLGEFVDFLTRVPNADKDLRVRKTRLHALTGRRDIFQRSRRQGGHTKHLVIGLLIQFRLFPLQGV